MEPVIKKLSERGISLVVQKKVKDFLADKGFDIDFGARPLKRTIQKYIQDPLSLMLLEGKLKNGSKISAEMGKDNTVIFR